LIPSLFPQNYATNIGGIKRRKKLFKVNNEGERTKEEELCGKRWKKGINRTSKNMTVAAEKMTDWHPTGIKR
jgi:hypothetical protein